MASGEQLRVGIIMGSDSDLKVMRHAGRALRTLGMLQGVHYEDRIVSAHRTPHQMSEYAATAEERGLRLIIAGAGGSAHLPGMVASETTLPVLGVSITDNPDVMNRALGSMIGMPEGKPLAVFQGPAGAFNAGLFAGRVLMATDQGMRAAYEAYELNMLLNPVLGKDRNLRELGAEEYLNQPAASL